MKIVVQHKLVIVWVVHFRLFIVVEWADNSIRELIGLELMSQAGKLTVHMPKLEATH